MLVVILMVFTVNVLLLVASGRLLGAGTHPLRLLAGGLLGTMFSGLGMVPGFHFLNGILWRLCALILSALLAYGLSRETLPKMLLFVLLHLSLSGITGSKKELISGLMGAAGIGFACLAIGKRRELIPVELTYGNQTLHLTALRDTGNTLRDPVSGKPVLIVDAEIAQKLTGLDRAALGDPVAALGTRPGLRLIPYRTIGNTGFLLAVSIPGAKIGNRQGSAVVALSPQSLGNRYQALTGGTL